MKITIDTDAKSVRVEQLNECTAIPLYSKASFELISELWVKTGWNEKYSYTFSWMGRPIIQLPADMFRVQEALCTIKPDVILETGIAHGGSLIYYASICKLMGKGRVIGIDVEIRPHNRQAIESHNLYHYITLIEGDSVNPNVIYQVSELIRSGETVIVILDSDHSKKHVLKELEAYSRFVTPDSYIIATDGIMKDLFDVPRGKPDWRYDNPVEATKEFLEVHPEFVLEAPSWHFNESRLVNDITYWPSAWLKRNY